MRIASYIGLVVGLTIFIGLIIWQGIADLAGLLLSTGWAVARPGNLVSDSASQCALLAGVVCAAAWPDVLPSVSRSVDGARGQYAALSPRLAGKSSRRGP